MHYLTYFSVSISLLALVLTAWNILRDRARLVVHYQILMDNDRTRSWLRLELMNVGRRPILITGFGYESWTSGWEILKGTVKPMTLALKEAELQTIDIDFPEHQNWWDVRRLFVVDHNGKKWRVPARMMNALYDHSHANLSLQSDVQIRKWVKQRNRQFDKAYSRYCKWAKRRNYTPKERVFKNFEDKPHL